MQKRTIITQSTWTNVYGDKLLVTGIKDPAIPTSLSTFKFSRSLFPCTSMETTFTRLSTWLVRHGWKISQFGERKYITDDINDETGEITCHWETAKLVDFHKAKGERHE